MFLTKKNDIIMKKIMFLLAVYILSACSDNFLEIYPETSLNESNFYQTEEQYITLVNGCYVPMQEYYKQYWAIAEYPSDNSSYMNNPLDDSGIRGNFAFDLFLVNPDNTALESFWSSSYRGIYNCNKLLKEIDRPSVTWTKASLKERCFGEALFLRALYYFNLVQSFGGVPIVLELVPVQEATGIKRSTEENVYEVIVKDLKEAISHFSNAMDVQENGRVNWGAASSLLGKVYLTMHQYADAEVQLKAVIDYNKYALLPNYADVFNPSKKDYMETIFAIQYSDGSVALSNRFIFQFAPRTSKGEITGRPSINISGSGGNNQPTDDLINAFETGDLRKNVSIKFWHGLDWDLVVRDIPYCAKFKPPISSPVDRCSDNMPIIRYSDVLLMYAEVLNEQGRTGDAIPYVQQVRNRAGLIAPLSGYTKATLGTLIANERQVEFCFENQRWFDLKRTGKALEVLMSHAAREKAIKSYLIPASYQLDPYKLLLPIPDLEARINGLEQNPGY